MSSELHAMLTRWFDNGDRGALEQAHALAARTAGVDVGALLGWIGQQDADPVRADLALRRIRHALGLPVVAGPACRPRMPDRAG